MRELSRPHENVFFDITWEVERGLGLARETAKPLLGRTREQNLLTTLLDEVGDRGQALVLRAASARAEASSSLFNAPSTSFRARDIGGS